MVISKPLTSFYEQFEGDLEIKRMFLTDKANFQIHQRQFEMLGILPGMHILDFGCGPGISTRDLARRADPGLVIGIDVKESAIKAAEEISKEESIENVQYFKMKAEKVLFPDNSFDMTFARNLLMSVPSPNKVLKEMFRVTKPNGLIGVVSSDGFMSNFYPLTKELRKHLEIIKNIQPSNVNMGRELFSKLTRLGLKNVRVHIDNYIGTGKVNDDELEYSLLMYKQIEPIADKIFANRQDFLEDKKVWFDFLQREDRFDFFQIFFVTGKKP